VSNASDAESKQERTRLQEISERARFEETVLPHLDAAYNLARWLAHDPHDAEDVVQEAYLRAFKFFRGFRGDDARAWLLTVVRHTCYTWMERHRGRKAMTSFDEEMHSGEGNALNPERLFLQRADRQLVREAVEALPLEFREVIVLREMEALSYQEIAGIINVPVGTVMSRLARGRNRLQQRLAPCAGEEG
jgi:RNA polymerase sigma factor (sigma-70 family)